MFRSIGLVLLLCSNLTAAAVVEFEQLSPFGDHNIDIKVSVHGVDFSQYCLVISSAAQGVGFWDKDEVGYSPSIVEIDSNGNAEVSYHTWSDTKLDSIATNFAAALYPKSAFPLPGSNGGSAGIPNYGYTAIAYAERWGSQTLDVGGHPFHLKTSQAPGYSPSQVGPGSNVFLPSAIYQNGGTTHLTVNNSVCSELVLANPLGYGTYTSEFNLNNLFSTPGVTFGAFYMMFSAIYPRLIPPAKSTLKQAMLPSRMAVFFKTSCSRRPMSKETISTRSICQPAVASRARSLGGPERLILRLRI